MLNRIKYSIVCLLVVALCASWMIAVETNAQTCGYGDYGPSYGYSSYPEAPMNAPMESSTTAETSAPAETQASTPSQTSGYGNISGTVAYSNGTTVAGAIVQLQSKSGAQYSGTSGADGHYEISNVQYDSYTIRFTKGGYTSPAMTIAVNTASVKRDISIPVNIQASSTAAIDHSDIQNWYATRYTPQAPSNKAVIYGQSGHIERVLTGIPCQSY